MVSASRLSACRACSTTSSGSPRRSAASAARRRANAISRVLSVWCVSHSSPSSTLLDRLPARRIGARAAASRRRGGGRRGGCIAAASQVRTWTPLVMWPIGTCSSLARATGRSTSPANAAVQRRDRVGVMRQLQRQHRHAERLVRVARIDAGPSPAALAVDAHRLAQRPEVLLDEIGRKAVVAGRDGRVGREDDVRGDEAQRLAGRQALALHALPHELERREGAVAFVQVGDAGRVAERAQRPRPADAEQQLLADAGPLVAAIEPRGQLAILGRVAFDVRVEQQQRAPPDRHRPHARRDRAGAGLDGDGDGAAVLGRRRPNRQRRGVDVEVLLLLPPSWSRRCRK